MGSCGRFCFDAFGSAGLACLVWQGAGAQQLCAFFDCLPKQLCKSCGHANACYRVLRTESARTT